MCGIIGIYSKVGIDKSQVEKAALLLRHRGPDNYGFYFDSMIGLGHRRLSIIDLSEKGKQPISNEKQDMHIVYNGEIYNFKELRGELEFLGHRFKSNTDSEVVLHAYEEWKENCLKRFNGMFAFAIWDDRNKRLFIARDRVGIKPLYYFFDKERFIFASEIKAILEFDVKKQINEKIIYDYFNYFIQIGDETLFENIKTLEPAHYMILNIKENSVIKNKWWDFEYTQEISDEKIAEQTFLRLFEESIKSRMMSDVPLGVFLSGGLDSSAIVAMMKKFSPEIKTFCVGSDENTETNMARKVSNYFNTEHEEIIITSEDFEKKLPEMIWHYDLPVSFASSIPLYFVSQLSKGKATVVLTGEGADELFAGYHRYARMLRAKSMSPFFKPILFTKEIVNFSDPRYKKNIELLYKFNPDYATDLNIIIGKDRDKYLLVEKNSFLRNQVIDFLDKKETNFLNKILYLDFNTYLVELLRKQDKMSMAASIESRVPFLDHKIVEFAARLNNNLKIRGGINGGKYLLKRSMSRYLPKSIIGQKKQGFPVPLEKWFRRELNPFVTSHLLENNEALNYFDKKYIRKLIERHKTKNCSLQLWAILNFKLWYDKFFQ